MNTLEIKSESPNLIEVTDSTKYALEISSTKQTSIEVSFAIVGQDGVDGKDGITEERAREIADEEINTQVMDYGALLVALTNF